MFARFRSFALIAALLAGVIAMPFAAGAQTAPGVSVPVTGASTPAGSTFSGQYNITHFVNQGGKLLAQGTLTGTLTNTATGATQQVNVPVQVPVAAATATCSILDLTLGPLDLNLLGLMVHLNTVHLTITAQSGPGNLLGNLLCAVSNLLNGGGAPLGALAGLLNQILAAL